jgi:hypothetical protein
MRLLVMAVDDAALERLRVDLLAAIRASEHHIRAELDGTVSASEARLAGRIAETRRHMDVVAEGLKSTIALVAEGVVTLTERLGAEMREGFESIDRRLLRVESRLLSPGSPGPSAGGGTAGP